MPFGQSGFFGGIADFLEGGIAFGQQIGILPTFQPPTSLPSFPQFPVPMPGPAQTAGGISVGGTLAITNGGTTAVQTGAQTAGIVAFKSPANGCPARPLSVVRVVNPDTGRETYYRHVGTPVRFSRDKAVIKKLSKDARQIVAVCSRPR